MSEELEKDDYGFGELKEMMKMLGDVSKQMQSLPNPMANIPSGNTNLSELKNQMQQLQQQTRQMQQQGVVLSFVNESNNPDPIFAKEGDSGFDLRANLHSNLVIKPMTLGVIPTGLYFEVQKGLEIQVRSRSGIARNHIVIVLNQPGTIDSGFRGEIEVMLFNLGQNELIVKHGDKVAQGVVCPVYGSGFLSLIKTDKLTDSPRGSSGFGSSGIN